MIPWLNPLSAAHFPPTGSALTEPNGLLAAGGQLNVEWLLEAYGHGIFPWFNEHEPILWWSPAPRTVLFPQNFHINRSFRKFLKKSPYLITRDQSFRAVMQACSEPRKNQPRSWISPAMIDAYSALFNAGYAHSYECWSADKILVGGLYGVAIGQFFYGESMFSHAENASKCCLKALVESGLYRIIDCQMNTRHLVNMGAVDITRAEFETLLTNFSIR
ncbi:MAG: leucyl/phenylalanyl-tRNA--protein transferase [Gammaproteobacteria bacterium]|nr:leucyl/phenylalanyl-tRNA--protein transferase [Gammaproteobacteria bacterium]MBL7000714.1 leucyl/phenylalanyl-tRNA--protein transferase [Gammaproteobacteria bacterium]